jgi:sterol desaturase/sphingolipid hydroxylase (fatty acid hydroxylase superfamily)
MNDLAWPTSWPAWLELVAGALGAAFVLLLPLELWQRWRAGRLSKAVVLEMLACMSPLVGSILVSGAVVAFVGTLYFAAATIAPWRIPTNAATAVAAVLCVDFLYYWDHRCAHQFRPYWAISHSVHHSSQQYDQTVGFRISFVDGFMSPWFYLPAVLIGFDVLLVLAAFALILGYQQWIHTETVGKLPWLDGWLNTPSNHRVHHGVNPQYIDKNYGAVLILWDRLLGTYEPEREQVRYGITQQLESSNPWTVHVAEFARMWVDVRGARTVREFWRRLACMPQTAMEQQR